MQVAFAVISDGHLFLQRIFVPAVRWSLWTWSITGVISCVSACKSSFDSFFIIAQCVTLDVFLCFHMK